MSRLAASRLARRALALFQVLWGSEEGQAMTEYSVVVSGLLLLGAGSMLAFIPLAIQAYKHYILGFYLILGLPIP